MRCVAAEPPTSSAKTTSCPPSTPPSHSSDRGDLCRAAVVEHRVASRQPPASGPTIARERRHSVSRPNVLVILTDQLRYAPPYESEELGAVSDGGGMCAESRVPADGPV